MECPRCKIEVKGTKHFDFWKWTRYIEYICGCGLRTGEVLSND